MEKQELINYLFGLVKLPNLHTYYDDVEKMVDQIRPCSSEVVADFVLRRKVFTKIESEEWKEWSFELIDRILTKAPDLNFYDADAIYHHPEFNDTLDEWDEFWWDFIYKRFHALPLNKQITLLRKKIKHSAKVSKKSGDTVTLLDFEISELLSALNVPKNSYAQLLTKDERLLDWSTPLSRKYLRAYLEAIVILASKQLKNCNSRKESVYGEKDTYASAELF